MRAGTKLRDLVVLAIFGPVLFLGDILCEPLPNIHLVGVLLVVVTAVYRTRALIPLYIYVFLSGLWGGFALWWIPYLYVWTVLWGLVMLIPRRLSARWQTVLYVAACALHGYLFGVLYAPAQAWLFGLDWRGMLTWIAMGFPFDLVHGSANLVAGSLLIYPLVRVLRKLQAAPQIG
ncbi:MAG: hypothetical protein IJ518_02470 [Clostridia bacterium]|nr:hypothetical protein [Clostridia bacterium]